ncbi:MAG: RNA polymerase sigma-54 factor, partial [Qipengyuania sp.]
MALGPRLDLRQTQSLVMTPQLQQAIKLLALSNLEIETFVGDALESNPLLEMGEVQREAGEDSAPEPQEHDSAPDFDGDNALDIADHAIDPEAAPGDMGDWSRGDIGSGSAELPDLENRSANGPTLAEHLSSQVGAVAHDNREALVAQRIIGDLDEAGYLL